MPYVVCASVGGPYDDASFVAGIRMQSISERMERDAEQEFQSWEPVDLVPQLDLIAMMHGYTMESVPWEDHPDEWSLVTFTKASNDR